MKTGRSLSEIAAELDRQQKSKRDFIADTRELELHQVGGDPKSPYSLKVNGHGEFSVTEHTHGQIANRLGIPKPYYDRLKSEAPVLLQENVQHWFREKPERRLIRTLDNGARAFLSDRYRPLDNYDLAQAVLPVLGEADVKFESVEVTDNRFYIKALFPKIEREVKRGDVVQSGIVISNSEIGLGALKVEPLVFRLVCLNGLISPDYSQRKAHLGRAADEGEAAFELYRDVTLQADDKAFWLKVQDTVRASLNSVQFERIVESLQRSTTREIVVSPVKAVETLAKRYQLNQSESDGVLAHLIRGADLSQYGLVNAITRASQDVPSYDRATELERLGGTVLELPTSSWSEVAEAA